MQIKRPANNQEQAVISTGNGDSHSPAARCWHNSVRPTHNVDRVKAHERDERPNIGLCKGCTVACKPALLGQDLLHPVQCLKHLNDGFVIGGLGGSKAAAVDTVIQLRVYPRVDFVNLGAERLRVQVESGVLSDGVALAGKHADDLGRLIADDGACLGVHQHGDSELGHLCTSRKLVIQLAHSGGAVDLVASGGRERRVKPPSSVIINPWFCLNPHRVHDRYIDGVFKALETTDHEAAAGPAIHTAHKHRKHQ